MDAALDIIVRDGYRAVSVESIVREVDVTRPVFYNVFDGLGALLELLLDRTEERALEQLTTRLSLPAPGVAVDDYLRETVRALVAMVREDPRTWTPIFLATVDTPDAVLRRVARDREVIRLRFREFLELALHDRADLDADVLAHSLVAIGEYFARMILQDPASVDADRLARTISAVFPR